MQIGDLKRPRLGVLACALVLSTGLTACEMPQAIVGGAMVAAAAVVYVGVKTEQYASEEARLDAQIAAAREDIARYKQVIADAERISSESMARIDSLRAQYRAGQITARQYRTQLGAVEQDAMAIQSLIEENQQMVQAYEAEIGEIRRSRRSTNGLVQTRNTLVEEREQLERIHDDLLAALGSAETRSN
jgi:chromosome segregation ATPase